MNNYIKKISKKLLSLIIVGMIAVGMLPLSLSVQAVSEDEQMAVEALSETSTQLTILDSGKCGDALYWELDSEGLLRIFGEGAMYDYNKYYQPSPWYKYRDEPFISEDGEYFLDADGTTYLPTADYYEKNPQNYKVSSVLIEDGVTYIGDWAFYRVCVKEITVPETVEATGIFCFRYSPVLEVLNLPDSLKVLDDFAVSRNYHLRELNLGNSLETAGTAAFNNNPSLKEILLPETCTTINKQLSPTYAGIDYSKTGLMENCSSLRKVSFGNVTEIPQRTCLGAKIEEAIIPASVKSIGEYAFYNCSELKSVTFEEGSLCTTIDNTAFLGCSSLESVTGGTSLEELGSYTSVKTLKEFEFSPSNKTLSARQFLDTSLKSVTVSDNISVIPIACFNSMVSLEEIYLPGTLTDILGSSFNYCYALRDIYFDGTLSQWLSVNKADGWNYKVNSECMLHLADGKSVSLWYNPTVYTVTFVDFDGAVIDEQRIVKGESATPPENPEREGYTFKGWDKDFMSVNEDIVVTATYVKNAVTAPTGTLRIDAGGSGFRISVNGGAERPQGMAYINSKAPVGATVTLSANQGGTFLGWMNAEGLILTEDYTYTFTTTGNDYVKALYQTDIEEATLVIFKNDKANQILDMQYYMEGDEIIFPEYPVNAAWKATGWTMTAEEIASAVRNGESVTVTPTWTKILVYVNVNVQGGTATGVTDGKTLKFGAVTAVANAAPEGEKFAYWADENGKVRSYSAEYTFYPAEDTNLTAVYVKENETVDYEIILGINMDTSNESPDVNTVILSWEVAESSDFTFVQAGALIVEESKYNADTFYKGTTDSNVTRWTPGSANQIPTKTITVNKKGVESGSTWILQGWLTYKDSAGNEHTVYTDLVYASKA